MGDSDGWIWPSMAGFGGIWRDSAGFSGIWWKPAFDNQCFSWLANTLSKGGFCVASDSLLNPSSSLLLCSTGFGLSPLLSTPFWVLPRLARNRWNLLRALLWERELTEFCSQLVTFEKNSVSSLWHTNSMLHWDFAKQARRLHTVQAHSGWISSSRFFL